MSPSLAQLLRVTCACSSLTPFPQTPGLCQLWKRVFYAVGALGCLIVVAGGFLAARQRKSRKARSRLTRPRHLLLFFRRDASCEHCADPDSPAPTALARQVPDVALAILSAVCSLLLGTFNVSVVSLLFQSLACTVRSRPALASLSGARLPFPSPRFATADLSPRLEPRRGDTHAAAPLSAVHTVGPPGRSRGIHVLFPRREVPLVARHRR